MSAKVQSQNPDVFYSFGECYDRTTFKRIENLDKPLKHSKKVPKALVQKELSKVGNLIKQFENN